MLYHTPAVVAVQPKLAAPPAAADVAQLSDGEPPGASTVRCVRLARQHSRRISATHKPASGLACVFAQYYCSFSAAVSLLRLARHSPHDGMRVHMLPAVLPLPLGPHAAGCETPLVCGAPSRPLATRNAAMMGMRPRRRHYGCQCPLRHALPAGPSAPLLRTRKRTTVGCCHGTCSKRLQPG